MKKATESKRCLLGLAPEPPGKWWSSTLPNMGATGKQPVRQEYGGAGMENQDI